MDYHQGQENAGNFHRLFLSLCTAFAKFVGINCLEKNAVSTILYTGASGLSTVKFSVNLRKRSWSAMAKDIEKSRLPTKRLLICV